MTETCVICAHTICPINTQIYDTTTIQQRRNPPPIGIRSNKLTIYYIKYIIIPKAKSTMFAVLCTAVRKRDLKEFEESTRTCAKGLRSSDPNV